MKKILKRTGKVFCLFLLIVVLVNILSPLFCRKPDETYVESLRKTEFTSETAGVERICCIDDNEEALLWRLRMIGTAKESIVLSTFDLRADDNGTKILAALNCAAARGVKIQLLIDGIYQHSFCMNRIIIHQFIHICPCFQNFLFLIKIICTAPWIRAFFHCIQHDLKLCMI